MKCTESSLMSFSFLHVFIVNILHEMWTCNLQFYSVFGFFLEPLAIFRMNLEQFAKYISIFPFYDTYINILAW